MYYVCDSTLLADVNGLSTFAKRDRDKVLLGMEKKYSYRRITGISGVERMGIDSISDVGRRESTYSC
jgi:hypothetical protein